MNLEDNKELITLSVQMGYLQKGFDTVEKKIDSLISAKADKKDLEDVKSRIIHTEKKIDSLTNWRYYFTGAAAAIGAAITLIIEWLKNQH